MGQVARVAFPRKQYIILPVSSFLLYRFELKEYEDNLKLVEALLSHGADPSIRFLKSVPFIFFAVGSHHLKTLKVLLESHADPNIRTDEGNTALMVTDDPDIARLFLEFRAKVSIKNFKGESALDFVKKRDQHDPNVKEILALLESAIKKEQSKRNSSHRAQRSQ